MSEDRLAARLTDQHSPALNRTEKSSALGASAARFNVRCSAELCVGPPPEPKLLLIGLADQVVAFARRDVRHTGDQVIEVGRR